MLSLLLFLAWPAVAADSVPERAAISADTPAFSGAVKALVLDADQTVRISTTKWRAPRAPSEVVILPGVREKVTEYNQNGYFVAIMSNQRNPVADSGLAIIDDTMKETVRQVQKCGARVDYYDFALLPDEDKPAKTMIDRMEAKLREKFGSGVFLDRAHSLMSGDAAYLADQPRPDGRAGFDTSDYDRQFAVNNGFNFREPQDFFGWSRFGTDRIENLKLLQEYERHAGKTPQNCPGL